MKNLDKLKIMSDLLTNVDFWVALEFCEEQVKKEGNEAKLSHLAIWFFSAGYISRMEFEESKKFLH
jgi:hypothetical protein